MAFLTQPLPYATWAPAPVVSYAAPPVPSVPPFAPLVPPACPTLPSKVRLTYSDGVVYEGEVLNLHSQPVPHGEGMKWWPTGERYIGKFWNGQFHGYGEMFYVNGDYYKGQYQHNKRHGSGESYRAANQRRYLGQFVEDREEGKACLTVVHPPHEGGPKQYDGDFLNNLRHGQGRLRVQCLDGTNAWFEGQWVQGLLHGPVRVTYHGVDNTVHYVNGVVQGYGQNGGWAGGPQYTYQAGMVHA